MNTNHGLLANIILIGVGIICGSIFFIVEMKDLSLIFFSIALASILYQFLGGIGDTNSFNLGAIKFGGSAAILLGFMWFLKSSTLFNDINIDPGEKRIKEFFLYPDSISKNSTDDYDNLALPFEVKVFNGSLFNIIVDGKEFISNSEIVPKTAYLIPYKDDISYVVFLEQASNKINETYKNRYSKWLVTKIKKEVLLSEK
jgi:hypothetical protein